MAEQKRQYPDSFVDRLEILWGEGFLSPGGPQEVREIVAGLDLSGKTILDIGCGTGGIEFVLASEFDTGMITAIDVEEPLLERARNRLANNHASIADRVDFRLVEPGPLDFPDVSFDVVFSKDAMIHIPDKEAIYREIMRVLKPGGVLAASDWLAGENTPTSAAWKRYVELGDLDFTISTAAEAEERLRKVGFADVTSKDRNAWYASFADQEMQDLEGPLRPQLLEVVDEDMYRNWLKVRGALRDAVKDGSLRPTHLRGHKPV